MCPCSYPYSYPFMYAVIYLCMNGKLKIFFCKQLVCEFIKKNLKKPPGSYLLIWKLHFIKFDFVSLAFVIFFSEFSRTSNFMRERVVENGIVDERNLYDSDRFCEKPLDICALLD